MIVYLARNQLNGKAYVGKTKRAFGSRLSEHLRCARDGASQVVYRAMRKHGAGAFDWNVLQECSNEAELNKAEAKWIKQLHTHVSEGGYNMTWGGDGVLGLKHTPETRARMSESRRGERNHNYGKSWGHKGPFSEESKQKMREAALGRTHNEEARVKISEALRKRVRKTRGVIQYDMNGHEVATYPSMREAALAVSGHKDRIGDCCRGSRELHAGYRWCYTEGQKGSR